MANKLYQKRVWELINILRRHNHEPAAVFFEPKHEGGRGWVADISGHEYTLGWKYEDVIQFIEDGSLTPH